MRTSRIVRQLRMSILQLGRVQDWFAPPLQVQISCRVPSVVVLPGSSRHLPDPVPTREEPAPTVHCWFVPPLQVHSSTRVPLTVPLPVTSRHLPFACSVLPAA